MKRTPETHETYISPLLRINLTEKKIQSEEIDRSLTLKFLGGRGVGAKILFDELKPATEPLTPENKLLMLAGPLVGTGAPWCVKYTAVTRSPLTGTILMSLAGGFFGANLRFAGCDGLVIEGRAEKPSYLWVHEGKAELRPASHLWGMNTEDCQEAIRKELGDDRVQIACIGPAGEKAVRFASIISGKRAAGRGGAGAVMGSKNLKAVAVYGTRKPPIAEAQRFAELQMAIRKKDPRSRAAKNLRQIRDPQEPGDRQQPGTVPDAEFPGGRFRRDRAGQCGRTAAPGTAKNNLPCLPVACGNLTRAGEGPYEGIVTEGPEYETFWVFGAQCGNTCIDAIIAADRLCDQLGMDTISTGSTIAFAMECAERGLISRKDLEGLDLRFGNHQAMVAMVAGSATAKAWGISSRKGVGGQLNESGRVPKNTPCT